MAVEEDADEETLDVVRSWRRRACISGVMLLGEIMLSRGRYVEFTAAGRNDEVCECMCRR